MFEQPQANSLIGASRGISPDELRTALNGKPYQSNQRGMVGLNNPTGPGPLSVADSPTNPAVQRQALFRYPSTFPVRADKGYILNMQVPPSKLMQPQSPYAEAGEKLMPNINPTQDVVSYQKIRRLFDGQSLTAPKPLLPLMTRYNQRFGLLGRLASTKLLQWLKYIK